MKSVEKEMSIIDEELYNACEDGNLQEVKRLLAAGANVNANCHDVVIAVASKQGHFEVVRVLLDNGANIDAAAGFVVTK